MALKNSSYYQIRHQRPLWESLICINLTDYNKYIYIYMYAYIPPNQFKLEDLIQTQLIYTPDEKLFLQMLQLPPSSLTFA